MKRWCPIRDKLRRGHILRWAETLRKPPAVRNKGQRPRVVGAYEVTAEFLRWEGRLMTLEVLTCVVLASLAEPLKPLKVGTNINRKPETIVNGVGHLLPKKKKIILKEADKNQRFFTPTCGPRYPAVPYRSRLHKSS
jgi:hypothetical protein